MARYIYTILIKCSFINYILLSVHPCDTASNGGCSQICKRNKDKHTCTCEDRFVLGTDGKTCNKGEIFSFVIVYNEWLTRCRKGMFLHFLHFIFLNLVHTCDEASNGGCSQICNKRKESHECSCEVGFVFGEDKRICKKG